MKRFLPALLIVSLVFLTGCGGDDEPAKGATATTVLGRVSAEVDWVQRSVTVRDEDDGPDIRFCEGEAPLLCVERDGTHLGVIELASYPADGIDDLAAWARAFYETMAADRSAGCDPAIEVVGDDPVRAMFAGHDGIRYGYTATIDGRPVERVLAHAAVVDGTLWLLTANALADESCLARESELPIDVMADLEPVLAGLAHGSELPPLPDGLREVYRP